jgi:hypothetical protein
MPFIIPSTKRTVLFMYILLLDRRSLVRFPMRSLNVYNLPNPSDRTMAQEFPQPATELSTRKSFWVVKRGRRVRLTTSPPSVRRLSKKYGTHNISQSYRFPWAVTGLALLFNFLNFMFREYGRRDPSRWPHGTLYLQKLAITSPTSGGRSVGIVRSQTETMGFFYVLR